MFNWLFAPFHWFKNHMRNQQRLMDLQVLWPALKAQAKDLGHARYAFMLHIEYDPAYEDMSLEEKIEYVNNLV